MSETTEHIHFVTGRLAERAVRAAAQSLSSQHGFEFSIDVLPITVAALMTPKWLVRHWRIPERTNRVVLPGYLRNHLQEIRSKTEFPVECGPRDVRDLPLFFGGQTGPDPSYGAHTIEIIAEVNHANRLSLEELIRRAETHIQEGADVIDLGCSPGEQWLQVGEAVKQLIAQDIKVSIDSFDSWEVSQACEAGAQLVLSVNSQNCNAAADWDCEVVVIPDHPTDEKSFLETINFLEKKRVPMRLDPILEPIGCGFANSLERYHRCRRSFPDAAMMMGIGNLTELTDSDSAGVNVVLLGFCEELRIQSVLTTSVINWARTSVRECDLARKLVHYACAQQIPPKHIEPELVLLRDERLQDFDFGTIAELSQVIRDHNVRIFQGAGEIHAVSRGIHIHHQDPFAVMDELLRTEIGATIDASHAFYLGFEMSKALTANTLGKQYTQDESLDWGFLTIEEDHRRLDRRRRKTVAEQSEPPNPSQ